MNALINLASTSSFSTQLGSDGNTINYTIITSLGNAGDALTAGNYTLQGMAHSSNLSGHYVLGSNIDASATATWNADGNGGFAGFAPIGNNSTDSNDSRFTGIFDGLGHTISEPYQ